MPFTQELCRAGYEQLYMAGMVGRRKCPARCRGSTNETMASTKTNWKIDPSFLNFSIPSPFQQEPHPTKQSTPEQSGSLRLRLSPSHPSGITETSILLQGNTHTSPGGLIYVVATPISLRSLLPLLAQPCLDPGCQLESSSPHSCLVQSDSQDMCSEFSALGFPSPFQLWIDFLQCLHIAGTWLFLPADFGGDNGQVSFHWEATKRQLESIQQREFTVSYVFRVLG